MCVNALTLFLIDEFVTWEVCPTFLSSPMFVDAIGVSFLKA